MAKGKIKSYNSEKNYGFIIDQESEDPIFFFYDKNQLKKQRLFDEIRPEFIENDIVKFDIEYDDGKKIAKNVRYIENIFINDILSRYETTNEFEGFLKVINDNKFLIKEKVNKLKINLNIEFWEDVEYYKSQNNEIFKFKLRPIRKNKPRANIRLSAELIDKKVLKEYVELFELLENETIITGTVTGQNSDGLFVITDKPQFSDLTFFCKRNDKDNKYKKGQTISFKIQDIGKNKNIRAIMK